MLNPMPPMPPHSELYEKAVLQDECVLPHKTGSLDVQHSAPFPKNGEAEMEVNHLFKELNNSSSESRSLVRPCLARLSVRPTSRRKPQTGILRETDVPNLPTHEDEDVSNLVPSASLNQATSSRDGHHNDSGLNSPDNDLFDSSFVSDDALMALPENGVTDSSSRDLTTEAEHATAAVPYTASWENLEALDNETQSLLHQLLVRRAELARLENIAAEDYMPADIILKFAIAKPKTRLQVNAIFGTAWDPRMGHWVPIIKAFQKDLVAKNLAEDGTFLREQIDNGTEIGGTKRQLRVEIHDKMQHLRETAAQNTEELRQARLDPGMLTSSTPVQERRLFYALGCLRVRMTLKLVLPKALIASSGTLRRIASIRPQTTNELAQIKGAEEFAAKATECGVDIFAFMRKHGGGAPLRSMDIAPVLRNRTEPIEVIDLTGD